MRNRKTDENNGRRGEVSVINIGSVQIRQSMRNKERRSME